VGGSSGISPEALLGLRTESQQTVGYETWINKHKRQAW
jgi:hypothetical protein